MRKLNVFNWRPASVVALGVFTLSVVAIGETRLTSRELVTKYGIDWNAAQNLGKGRLVAVEPPLTEADLVLPPAVANSKFAEGLDRLPVGVPILVFEQMDDASIARGDVAAGPSPSDAVVFQQKADSGFFFPNKSDAGNFSANHMAPGNGWTPPVPLTGYDFMVFNSSGGPSGPADVNAELWIGDPLAFLDTLCGAPAPIAGTQCTFSDILDGSVANGNTTGGLCANDTSGGPPNCVGLHRLRCNFAGKVTVPGGCDHVWMVWDLSQGCRVGWRTNSTQPGVNSNSMAKPSIGFSDGFEMAFDCGQFGLCGTSTDNDGCANPASGNNCGTCCNNGNAQSGIACDATDGVNECVNATGGGTFCSNGVADLATAFTLQSYGAYYASYVATMFAPSQMTLTYQPVANNPDGSLDPGVSIVGQEMRMAKGGRQAYMDFRVGDWDPTDTGKQIKAYQVQVDSAGYTSALAGTLTPYALSCAGEPDGAAFCEANVGLGASCDFPPGCGGVAPCACTPGYIHDTRGGANPFFITLTRLCGADLSTLNYRLGCTITAAGSQNDPSPYPAGGLYGGTVVLDVPADAKGTFTLSFFPPNDTSFLDQNNLFIPLLGFIAGQITIDTGQCCDLNVLPFVCLGDDFTGNECAAAGGVFSADKTCADACGCLTDDQCDDGRFCTDDACDTATSNCVYTDHDCGDGLGCTTDSCNEDTDSCDHAAVVCDDSLGCTDDFCREPAGNCDYVARDPNDSNPCTVDACNEPAGDITNTDVNSYACTTSADCLAQTGVAFDCIQGFCFCTVAPVCGFSDVPACVAEGTKINVDLRIGPAAAIINGVQINVSYDPSCLNFNSIVPAGSVIPGNPYVTEIDEQVDEAAGHIFYAVGVDPFGGVGVNGNVAIARISFTKVGNCNSCSLTCGGGNNPTESVAVDDEGQPVFIDPGESGVITSADDVDLTVPDDVKSNVDCDYPTAIVTWDPPSASSDCPGGVDMHCEGLYPNGAAIPAGVVNGGGEFPVGTSTLCCKATTQSGCGGVADDCWTVTVNEQTTLDVTVQLSPVITGEVDRCITFQLYSDCVQAPMTFTQTLHFGGLFDHVGHFTDDIKIPDAGQWVCITARDQLHTLRACDFLECVGGDYIAVFKGDPFFGGNWLIGGNLDGWKKFNPNASHNVIDILDFGQYVANHGEVVNPNTPCGPGYDADAHADINGDGIVNSLDYAFVIRNFLASSKDCCCPGSAAAGSVARTEISVGELRQLDMADLAVADLNADGVVNSDDMAAFMAGQTPVIKGNGRTRDGGLQSGKR